MSQSMSNNLKMVQHTAILAINVKNGCFITMCKAHSKVTHIKTAKIFSLPQAPWI